MSDQIEAIRSTFDDFCAAWESHDGATVAAAFAEDGSLINPFGEHAGGREAIAAMYSGYFQGMLRGTSTTFTLGTVRAVENNHALVDAEQSIQGPDGSAVLVVHLAALMRREGDGWKFVDGRPYVLAPMPG